MLIKLMKYELKATARLLIPLYFILAAITLINRVVLRLDIYEGILAIIPGFLIATYVALIIAILTTTFLLMIIRFYKNLITDEGYLMHTLPAKPYQLIGSKLIIAAFWIIVSVVIILGSLYVAFVTPEIKIEIVEEIKRFVAAFKTTYNSNIVIIILEVILMVLLTLSANILLIYVSIAAGQLFTGHRIVGSFVSYMVIYTLMQIFMLIVIGLITFFNFDKLNALQSISIPPSIFPFVIILTLAQNVAFFGGTNYIFKKKLNLE